MNAPPLTSKETSQNVCMNDLSLWQDKRPAESMAHQSFTT